jgi:threonine aldolase
MRTINRRTFLSSSGIAAAGMGTMALAHSPGNFTDPLELYQKINFTRDGLDLSPAEYSVILGEIIEQVQADAYSRGGIVEELENKFASLLGKEQAIFMPTGTLANHLAIRKLAGSRKKAIVQADSHIYRDSGDCVQELSGITLLPLNEGKVTFSLEMLRKAIWRNNANRVYKPVGVIVIESPVRRLDNRVFPYEEMEKISAFAKENGIAMHLDGARLFNASVHTGIGLETFTGLFDTVYVSLYKNFNAPSGAILAGDSGIIKGLHHERRMFGGGLPQAWVFAAIALRYADSFISEYTTALGRFRRLSDLLGETEGLRVEELDHGTNVFKLRMDERKDAQKVKDILYGKGIVLPDPENSCFKLKINPSLNRSEPDLLAADFRHAVDQA